jgi:hypothetical protein
MASTWIFEDSIPLKDLVLLKEIILKRKREVQIHPFISVHPLKKLMVSGLFVGNNKKGMFSWLVGDRRLAVNVIL